jgi:calcineurin-like phosphoesterase family protein
MNTKSYFTADWHLFHANIIKYSNRPFQGTADMNRTILERLNEKVGEDDWLYFLGDMAFVKDSRYLEYWLDQVRCKNICVIKGNHDRAAAQIRNRFYWFKDLVEIDVDGQAVTLCHYAMRVWNKSHHGAWHLYGHSHGSLPDDPNALSIDVGVDTNDFYPYSMDDIAARMAKKSFKPIDHHGSR